jgi:hypothetical protein
MEDVLDLYSEESDPKRPVVCFDESPTQLIGEVRLPIPAMPGQLERYDCEYKRKGTARFSFFYSPSASRGHAVERALHLLFNALNGPTADATLAGNPQDAFADAQFRLG